MTSADIERLKNLANALQSIFVAIGIVIGGIWTFLTYNLSQQIKNAELDLLEKQNHILQQQKDIDGEVNMGIRLRAKQICGSENDRLYIEAELEFENLGTRSAIVDLSNRRSAGLVAIQHTVAQNGKTAFGSVRPAEMYVFDFENSMKPSSIGIIEIPPKITKNLKYWIPVSSAGDYVVYFNAPMSKSDIDKAKERLTREGRDFSTVTKWQWTAKSFIAVKSYFCEIVE